MPKISVFDVMDTSMSTTNKFIQEHSARFEDLFVTRRQFLQRAGMGFGALSLAALLGSTLIYVFALLSLGLLISTRAENQMQALQMTMIFIMPSVFFSGFIFPRETMPWIFYAIGSLLPTTYFIELARAIILRGASLTDFWSHLAVLAGMGIGLFILCALRFKRRIA